MKLVTSENSEKIVTYLTEVLQDKLRSGKHVLWLVPGGSAIAVAAAVSKNLQNENLGNLTVSLTDERFGDLDHADENWPQLLAAGVSLPGAQMHRVLTGQPRDTTTAQFASFLYDALASNDFSIGLFGMGSDGHTAGIKPNTNAVVDDTLAENFTGTDFERITMTTYAISQLSEAVLYAFGQDKFVQIDALLHKEIPLAEQPVQVLKLVPKSTLFSDYKESK